MNKQNISVKHHVIKENQIEVPGLKNAKKKKKRKKRNKKEIKLAGWAQK